MRNRLLSIFLTIALLAAAPAAGQQQTQPDSTSQAQRIALLQQEVRLLEEHTEEIQATANAAKQGLWGLIGGSLFLIAVIGGLPLWRYNQRYKTDRDLMEERLRNTVEAELEEARVELRDTTLSVIGKSRDSLLETVDDNHERMKKHISSVERRLKGEIDKDRLARVQEEIRERLKGEYLSDYILTLGADALGLTRTAHTGFTYQSDVLDLIRSTVNKLVEKEKQIDSRTASRAYSQLEKVEDKYREEANEIKEMIKEARS